MACSSQDSFAYIESLQHPTIAILLIKILISFRPLSSVHLLRSNQHFQAIEFVDRHVSDKLASITQRFLVPVSTVSARNTLHNDLPFCVLKTTKNSGGYFQRNWEGVCGTLPETLTLLQTKICDFPYSISYLKPWSLERDKLLRQVRGSWRKH